MACEITCPFSIQSSHDVESIGFRGSNTFKIKTPITIESPFGLKDVSIYIDETGDEYLLGIKSFNARLDTIEVQLEFVEKVLDRISFLIAKKEVNQAYGTPFIKPMWFKYRATPKNYDGSGGNDALSDSIVISDALSIKTTRTTIIKEEDFSIDGYPDILHFYVNGLRAEGAKSKYFHWFLILEYLENTDRYKELFDCDKLFNEDDKKEIKCLAERMGEDRKYSALLSILHRTKLSRVEKLFSLITLFGINFIHNVGSNECVSISNKIIKDIIDGRNKLFHSGDVISEDILWNHLFPLVTLIVEHILATPKCLEGASQLAEITQGR